MTEYIEIEDENGILHFPGEIEKGDLVCFLDAKSDNSGKHPKTIKVKIYGI